MYNKKTINKSLKKSQEFACDRWRTCASWPTIEEYEVEHHTKI